LPGPLAWPTVFRMSATTLTLAIAVLLSSVSAAAAQTSIRIMPPDRGTFAVGQRFDIRVEATSATAAPPRGLVVTIDGRDGLTASDTALAGSNP
jgi:hypothetical protein